MVPWAPEPVPLLLGRDSTWALQKAHRQRLAALMGKGALKQLLAAHMGKGALMGKGPAMGYRRDICSQPSVASPSRTT